MSTITKDPITHERTTIEPETALATQVVARLGAFEVSELPEDLTPYLAAASAELAIAAGSAVRFSPDGVTVAFLRMISRATLAKPDATGPHTQRLFEQLELLA